MNRTVASAKLLSQQRRLSHFSTFYLSRILRVPLPLSNIIVPPFVVLGCPRMLLLNSLSTLALPLLISHLPPAHAATTSPAAWAADILAIRNTLALYPLAIDSKNFSSLSLVFTPDVSANYSTPIGVLSGLKSVETTLEALLKPVTTQHSYGTQFVDTLASEVEARSVTYYTASQFGTGAFEGQVRACGMGRMKKLRALIELLLCGSCSEDRKERQSGAELANK